MSEQNLSRYMAWFEKKKKDDPDWWQKRMRDHENWVAKKKAKDPEWEERYNTRRYNTLKKWRRENPDRIDAIDQKSWEKRRKHPEKLIWQHVKSRAKRSAIEFNLDISDIVIPEKCPVLGIPVIPFAEGGLKNPNLATVDKIEPKKGYTKGNVKVISWKANRIKNDCADPEVFLAIAKYLKDNLDKNIDKPIN